MSVVTETVVATVGHIVGFGVEEGAVGFAAGALGAGTAEEAHSVLYDWHKAAPALQSHKVEVVSVSALVVDVVMAEETDAAFVPAAAEFVLGMLDVEIALVAVTLPSVSVVHVVQSALPAVAAELLVPAAVMQAVSGSLVVGLVVPPG